MKQSTSRPADFLFYVLTGDDFARKIKIESLLQTFLPGDSRTTNLFRYHADDLDWAALIAQAKTVSLMGGHQVFWVSEIDEIKVKAWENFAPYCEHPVPESRFIFEAMDLDKGHPVFTLTKKYGTHLHFSESRSDSAYDYLREKLRRAGKRMLPSAWQALEERSGGARRLMDLCLDQLILYVDGDTIEEDDVIKISAEVLSYDPFDLANALAVKNIPLALKIFHHFYDLDGDMTGSLGLVHWQLRRIWHAKRLLRQGNSREEIGRALRISSYRLPDFLNQVQQFEESSLEKLIRELWQTDWKSKTGANEPLVAMESFLASV